ncbi:prepilin peptidase [Enterococcus sp. LJL128]
MTNLLLFIFGACLGSFYCLTAERIPKGGSILSPASHCPHCSQKLQFYELIPLFSVILQRFRCNYCAKKIPFIYFFSELSGGSLGVLCFSQEINLSSLHTFLLLSMGLLLSLTDIFYMIVEPRIFYPCTFILIFCHSGLGHPLYFQTCLIVFSSLCLLNKLIEQSIGYGDVLLLSFWGLLLDGKGILFILFFSSGSALLYALFQRIFFRRRVGQIPFVPFLLLGLILFVFSSDYPLIIFSQNTLLALLEYL